MTSIEVELTDGTLLRSSSRECQPSSANRTEVASDDGTSHSARKHTSDDENESMRYMLSQLDDTDGSAACESAGLIIGGDWSSAPLNLASSDCGPPHDANSSDSAI